MFFDRASEGNALRMAPSQTKGFLGPARGWIKNESLAMSGQGGAEQLDNFFPTPEGGRMRAGSTKHATIEAAVKQLMPYHVGGSNELFAASATKIYDITNPADADVSPTALVDGQTNGDWAFIQFSTSGGNFLVAVNGADNEQLYDGSLWFPIDSNDIKTLAYDAQTGDFTLGDTVTGGTSGATATIVQDDDQGTSGTLYVKSISGTFQDNETITDASTGSATSDIPSGVGNSYTGITGVNTSDLSHVWAFKKRLFYIEDGTLSAWYLGTLSIGGAATEFPLKGLFRKGGSLLFGSTLSRDAGDGLDDFCVFVTTEGEVAIYQGTDPASWSLVGVYDIGQPLGKNAHFRAGGDVAVLCDDGILSIEAAITKSGAALTGSAITYPIEQAWRDIIKNRKDAGTWTAALWHKETALMVGIPTPSGGDEIMYVANSRTGAWCRYTGWPATAMAVLDDNFYYGRDDATIHQGEVSGQDVAGNYSAVFVPRFDTFGSAAEKAATHARFIGRAPRDLSVQLFANADYEISVPTPTAADPSVSSDTWGSGVWGTAVWGAPSTVQTLSEWQAVAAVGHALAPGLQITSGRTVRPDVEIVALHLQYEAGEVLG